MRLQQPLSTLGVPLDAAEADVPLGLQSLVSQCYRDGRYDDIDYHKDLLPPLPREEAAWTDQLLRPQGLC